MIRTLAALATLTGVYLLTLASLDPLDALAGVLVAAVALALTRRLTLVGSGAGGPPLAGRIVRFFPFALAVVGDVVAGTWEVAVVVLGARELRRPGIVAVPVGQRTETGIVATAIAITLSPGEVFVDLDRERGVMLFHVLDARDPDAVRRRHELFYERYQRGVFP
ncbi:MAG: Na+/H+ antiporter subunit E [Thermoleophilaceae bacterium]